MNKIYLKALLLIGSVCLLSANGNAQINPMGASFFQNQYQFNPAMAGLTDKKVALNFGFKAQWNALPGAPFEGSVTADYGASDHVGLGVNLYNEKAGLIKSLRALGTYVYRVKFNPEGSKQLRFGLSVGVSNEWIDPNDVIGSNADPLVSQFNQRSAYLDGDFGIAYTGERLTIQGAVPRLKKFLNRDDDLSTFDYETFYSAVSYKFSSNGGLNVEPMLCYRGIHGMDNIVDFGANATLLNEQLILMAMYHTTKSTTFGLGMNFRQKFTINGMFTTENPMMQGYTAGEFEVNLKFHL
ncbi:type IX secretion system membrane protein PorP/SprF [Pedobacter sp. HMF7647]|uniref:Type IX secretion system membrane protein PorP/SprF n=1 Tax=Hufsiella arboris TaxID=2695275 RepID=A0A7K1YCY0_9SPHI|nr:PorP/SprF family type IX secretion system membrane protein [Hufsiella arboris]MXV52444.1 type IX secretion system membrane protein PorP/SprF [Hufsiella arboris]